MDSKIIGLSLKEWRNECGYLTLTTFFPHDSTLTPSEK